MSFTFGAMVAYDPNSNTFAKNASFQAYATTDTGFTTPLAILNSSGGNFSPVNTLNSGSLGILPQFSQATNSVVVLRDSTGTWIWTVVSVPAPNATASTVGVVQLAGDLGGSATAPTVPALANKVQIGGDISGTITSPTVAKVNGVAVTGTPTAGQAPLASSGTAAAWGNTVNSLTAASAKAVVGGTAAAPTVDVADATASQKGAVQLAGNLGGTAASPSVVGVQGVAVSATAPTAGQVLTASSGTAAAWATPAAGGVPTPVIPSGWGVLLNGGGAASSMTGDLATYLWPMYTTGLSITASTVQITTAAAGVTMRLSCLTQNSAGNWTLQFDFGTFALDATGLITVTASNTIPSGQWWLGMKMSATSGAYQAPIAHSAFPVMATPNLSLMPIYPALRFNSNNLPAVSGTFSPTNYTNTSQRPPLLLATAA